MYRFQIQLVSDQFDHFGEETVAIPDGAAVCRIVVCYRIQEYGDNFDRENYLLMREPVCDYSKDLIDESVILWWRVYLVNVRIIHTVPYIG